MTSAYDTGAEPRIELRHLLRIAREFAGLEQEELAERMEVNRGTISNAETGHVVPRRATVNAWALACGVRVSWIRGEHPGSDPQGTDGLGIIRPGKTAPPQLTPQVVPFRSRGRKNRVVEDQIGTNVA
jgi:transcriptional regulator with XRE-family HTH domain